MGLQTEVKPYRMYEPIKVCENKEEAELLRERTIILYSRNFSKSRRYFPECEVKRGGGDLGNFHFRVEVMDTEET